MVHSTSHNNHHNNNSNSPTRPPPSRPRTKSNDIPRTYSGLFGDGNDLLPFELSRNQNTEWLANAGPQLLLTYLTVIFMFIIIFLGFFDYQIAWTVSHTVHLLVTMVYLHWIKGDVNFYEQGEMNAMTLWEQLDSTQDTANAKLALLVVPTLLCYAACHFSHYHPQMSAWNVVVWIICVAPKTSMMNGVRVLGINRTTGIDDDYYNNSSSGRLSTGSLKKLR